MTRLNFGVLICFLGGCASAQPMHDAHTASAQPSASASKSPTDRSASDASMRLGKFSISLTVKDIAASRAFYEKLGFHVTNDHQAQNWLVLQNETATIGLFQGMFDRNMVTFNPGRDRNNTELSDFDDVRDLQKTLVARGLTPDPAADESTTGPAYLMLTDPDGNPILIDQGVPSPKR